jgi:hypothetical protein
VQGAPEGLDHFIVAVAAKQGVWVGDDGDAHARTRRIVDATVNAASRAVDHHPARSWRHLEPNPIKQPRRREPSSVDAQSFDHLAIA